MKLLITGSSGFLGRRAAVWFTAMGYEVLTPSHGQLDITEKASVEKWFRENRPQAVIHCAAVSDTGVCQREPERSARINVDGTVHLAESCAEIGAKLVFCSSDQVYFGSRLPGPHSETEAVLPVNVYGRQKLLAEQRSMEICPDAVCLRLSWMYSAQVLPKEHGHFLTTLLAALEDAEKSLSWPIHDRRGLTDVDVVIKNLPAALKLPGGVYNFGSENDTDTFHTVQFVLESLGLDAALERLTPNEAAGDRDISMDLCRTAAAGIEFPTTKQGLCDALKRVL